ncbi:MAG: DNA polymerase IV 1 [Chlamydiae bacterium]|nr:DNA polymerase IV 1 [Chlamydiota bacterium]
MSSTRPGNFFLVDCNSFYVSCERVFDPKLAKRAVVVLSNNDGCVIARSKEAKALGIPMGAPAYQYAPLFKAKGVEVFSSNYTLYGDMSHRVMQVLAQFSPDMEEYSIDEAFLFIETIDPVEFGREIKERVFQWTGIPVSVGIAKTKTLAKVANHHAKGRTGVCLLDRDVEAHLSQLPVEKVWGVGRRLAERLAAHGIRTAAQFCQKEPSWIRKQFSVTLEKTTLELRGISCLQLDDIVAPKKSITCSRSFGNTISQLDELSESLASFVARAARKLRKQSSEASSLTIFLSTSPFIAKSYARSVTIDLPEPTSYTPALIQAAKRCLKTLFRPDYPYKKTGVILGGIIPKNSHQQDLFGLTIHEQEKQSRLMQTADRLSPRGVRFADEGACNQRRQATSPHSTTNWNKLPIIVL